MERKDLTPAQEMLLNLYNDNHEYKIKLKDVKEIYVEDNKLCIVCKDYDEEGLFFGYIDYTMDTTLKDIVECSCNQYHRAIDLAMQNVSPNRWLSLQEICNLQDIYLSYEHLLYEYITSIIRDASNGLVEVDIDYEKIFYQGDYISFHDSEGTEYKLRFEWFLEPDLVKLKEYFANYEMAKAYERIYQCQDDIERYKRLITEREEELRQFKGLNVISFKRRTSD